MMKKKQTSMLNCYSLEVFDQEEPSRIFGVNKIFDSELVVVSTLMGSFFIFPVVS